MMVSFVATRRAFGRQYNRKASAEKVITGGNSIEIENCPVKSSYGTPSCFSIFENY